MALHIYSDEPVRSPRRGGFRRGGRHHNNPRGSLVEEWIVENFVNDFLRKKEDEAKKTEVKKDRGVNTTGLAMLLFLLTPVIGPMYVYFTVQMLHSSLELLQKLPIK